MDIQLPVKNGIEATLEIRELERQNNIGTFPSTPSSEATSPSTPRSPSSPQQQSVIIVALTAGSHQSDRVEALAAGCNDFLTKPVSLPWLQQKLLEWGSMAYLSGFGPRRTPPPNTTSLNETADAKASVLASQLYIERRAVAPKLEPALPVSRDSLPSVDARSFTPERSDSFNSVMTGGASNSEGDNDSPPALTELTGGLIFPDMSAEMVPEAGASRPLRPGPTPLTAPKETIADVLAEGSRLLQAGANRTRSDSTTVESFASVMMGSAMRDDGPDREPRPVLVPTTGATSETNDNAESKSDA
jgi:CheY-like chemotaxis protein